MAGISGLDKNLGSQYLTNQIDGLGSVSGAKEAGEESGEVSFSDILNGAIQNSEALNTASNCDTLNLLSGNTDDLAGLMIGAKKSEVALDLTVAIRNKAMDAYKEIMNMQV
jgi:flagellar hook-basal body complex protein FliE